MGADVAALVAAAALCDVVELVAQPDAHNIKPLMMSKRKILRTCMQFS
jgi:hypothetical protein